MGRDRVLALNEESLKTYFEDLGDCISRNEIPPDDMWDLGEKRFMAGRTIPSTLEEARPQIDALGSAARKPEADLAVVKGSCTRPLAAKGLLSRVGQYSQNLVTSHRARDAQEAQLPTTRKRKPKNLAKEAPFKRSRSGRQGMDQYGVILVDSSGMER